MKTNRKVFLLAFLAIVLVLTSTSCSDPRRGTKAEVRVIGTAVGENNNSRAVSTMKFGSGKVIVGDKDVTASLVPVGQPSDGQNNVEFTTTVPVVGNTVKYTVSAKRGFVFDEWEFDRRTVMNDFKDIYKEKWVDVLREILRAIAGDRQTIEINPDYIRFIRPTFDRGVHFDPNYIGEGDGSSEKPFNDINDVLGYIKNESRFDDDELTIKFRSGNIGSFDLSKIEAGKMDFVFKNMNIHSVVDYVKSALSEVAKEHGLTLNSEETENLPDIYADSQRLEQVLTNLVSNAIKFTPEGKNITIKTELINASDIKCHPYFEEDIKKLNGEYIMVSVADEGIGIAEKDLLHAFDKFAQLENSLSRKVGGSGLGLPIAKQLLEAHQGTIWCDSTPDVGSTFHFVIPVAKVPVTV